MESIKIAIAGPRGRMGKEAVALVEETPHFELAGVLDRINGGKRLNETGDGFTSDAMIYTDVQTCLFESNPDVLIDLTVPETGMLHARTALEMGVRPVVGTTGFTEANLAELKELAETKHLGIIIAPNFAVGAVLMMKFSQMAARYFPDIEIIEQHHDQKLDAPSGTGIKTAEMISAVREDKSQGHPSEKEVLDGARGASYNGIRIHSVRLPGLVAHQEVLFGGEGQTLKIRHDSYDRKSFMSGVRLCAEQVMKLDTLVYGLENIIE